MLGIYTVLLFYPIDIKKHEDNLISKVFTLSIKRRSVWHFEILVIVLKAQPRKDDIWQRISNGICNFMMGLNYAEVTDCVKKWVYTFFQHL